MRLFDRRVARSAPSERARDARRGGDAGECVQMRDGVLTMHTRRARPRHRRDARRARAPAEPPTDRHRRRVVVSRSRAKRNAMPSQRFALGVSTARVSRKANIGCVSRSNARLRSAILSIRRGGADQRAAGFFYWRNSRNAESELARETGAFPLIRATPRVTRVMKGVFPSTNVACDVRRHSRTARVQALRSASRRAFPEFSSLRARAQRARVVRAETDARARVPGRIHGVAHQRVFFRIPRNSAALRHG